MTSTGETTWTELTGLPPELLALAERCYAADGGMPLATDPAFLGRRWASAFGLRAGDGSLLAAGAVRPGPFFTGLVDPDARGRGLGAEVLDRGLALAAAAATGGGVVTVESETMTDDAAELFESRGLRQTFAEDVMRIDDLDLPPVDWPAGVTVTAWDGPDVARRFHATYHESFRDRPGFPGDPADEWIAENEEDDDFLPGCSLLVTLPDLGDAGFVVAARGWIVQAGVAPFARRRGLAAALITESLNRMRSAGKADHAWLTVNINNPGAAALYRRLGFEERGLRARYQRPV
ncbi:GNAT family N-acetyltransferase [Paractinoplanes lichenicola]|uniref:GNAT family N-acetyltransferase n=1 Tax=Paractinoplanes lichenicola TaxID=2802976 RepID=A0ABS1VRA3_9ACTN|nr:N-acetyltransferase [Actinoplanes lichenicola]MBL7256664.1 GNAT family N-acetyltransferase [Actinoplanes lichenicola]